MKYMASFATLGLITTAFAAEPPAIIPLPAEMTVNSGTFLLTPKTTISATREVATEAQYLAGLLNPPTGLFLKALPAVKKQPAEIQLSLDPSLGGLGPEAYTLSVTPSLVVIKGASAAGAFYGVQTFRQLLPPQIESRTKVGGVSWEARNVEIKDWPRFGWRGLMLDVSRHFYGKDEIKKLLDAMAFQKMSTFHWHLVDDNGWRIEIKKYPKLTQVGAWRKDIGFGLDPKSSTTYGADGRYGGFYTQDDIREIVAYAKNLHITIIPEIEMPGHSGAALSAYPQYICDTSNTNMSTDMGAGVHSSVYCAGKDETFAFLQDVLSEVFALFPGKYVHIGGDEVPKGNWQKCPKCQERIKGEGLKDAHELQSYFIRRVEKIVAAGSKTLIGWSEIREGGLAQSAVLMDWIGGAVEGASAGHDVVMSPNSHCYFDYYQARHGEPHAIGGFVPLKRVYSFDPVPAKLAPEFQKHILGAQGNIWTEYIASPSHMQYMAFPRGAAMAEDTWTPAKLKNYDDFRSRLPHLLAHLEAMGVNYRKLTEEPKPVAEWKSGEMTVAFAPHTWDISTQIKDAGNYEVTFQYTGGGCRLDLEWVALLANGNEIARDTHPGVTGGSTKNNIYKFTLPAPATGTKYELKASARSDGGTDSNGEITVEYFKP
jgi:hexosaminidase